MAKHNRSEFNAWFQELQILAAKNGFALYHDQEAYRDYFEDGDSPTETLEIEIEARDTRTPSEIYDGQ